MNAAEIAATIRKVHVDFLCHAVALHRVEAQIALIKIGMLQAMLHQDISRGAVGYTPQWDRLVQ